MEIKSILFLNTVLAIECTYMVLLRKVWCSKEDMVDKVDRLTRLTTGLSQSNSPAYLLDSTVGIRVGVLDLYQLEALAPHERPKGWNRSDGLFNFKRLVQVLFNVVVCRILGKHIPVRNGNVSIFAWILKEEET